MSKVLIVATSRLTRGGITSVVKSHEQGAQWKKFNCEWIETHRDGSKFTKLSYLISAFFKYLLALPKCDIVHIHFSNYSSLRRKLIFARMAYKLNKKIIIHFHAFDPNLTVHGPHKSAYWELFKLADRIIVLSNWWREEVVKAFPSVEKITEVIYNSCPAVENLPSVQKKNKILYAGTVNKRKGYEDLIRAFAKIASKHPDWSLSIAGNGEIENGERLAGSLGISNQVEFLGWVRDTSKQKAFQEASIFCLPSYAEGFPMAVLDAWAYGLPVITTPVGGIPDIAEDGENMLLFTPGDISGLSKQLDRLITDSDLRAKICEASRSLSQKQFNVQTINDQIGKLYSKVYNSVS